MCSCGMIVVNWRMKSSGWAPGSDTCIIVAKRCNYNLTWQPVAQKDSFPWAYIVKRAFINQWTESLSVRTPKISHLTVITRVNQSSEIWKFKKRCKMKTWNQKLAGSTSKNTEDPGTFISKMSNFFGFMVINVSPTLCPGLLIPPSLHSPPPWNK